VTISRAEDRRRKPPGGPANAKQRRRRRSVSRRGRRGVSIEPSTQSARLQRLTRRRRCETASRMLRGAQEAGRGLARGRLPDLTPQRRGPNEGRRSRGPPVPLDQKDFWSKNPASVSSRSCSRFIGWSYSARSSACSTVEIAAATSNRQLLRPAIITLSIISLDDAVRWRCRW